MKFLLLIHDNPDAIAGLTEQQLEELAGGREAVAATARELLASGELVSVLALEEPGEQDVQLIGGTPVISDRPLLETKEFLAGAMVLDCVSRERALEIAGHIPLVHLRRVELREVRLDQNDFLAELDQL